MMMAKRAVRRNGGKSRVGAGVKRLEAVATANGGAGEALLAADGVERERG